MFLERFIFTIGLETGHPCSVSLTVDRLHIVHTIFRTLYWQCCSSFLAARSFMATDSTSPNTIWPRLSISETGYVCSAWPRLAGPVLVVQFVPGFCDRGVFLSARRCCLRFKIASLFLTYHSCFRCFANSGSLFGVTKTGSCPGSSSISIVLSANHSPRSRNGAGGGICTLGGPPLIFLLSIKPIT